MKYFVNYSFNFYREVSTASYLQSDVCEDSLRDWNAGVDFSLIKKTRTWM